MKKIRNYEVEVNEQGIATRMWANDKRVYPYAITKKWKCSSRKY